MEKLNVNGRFAKKRYVRLGIDVIVEEICGKISIKFFKRKNFIHAYQKMVTSFAMIAMKEIFRGMITRLVFCR